LEDSEDRRSVGGHGNQHVRLRIAQVDHIETFCPALAALCCFEPRQTSGAGFPPVQDFRTSPRKVAQPASRHWIDGLVASVDAVRRLAEQALAFDPPKSDVVKSDVAAAAPGPASPLTGIQGFRVAIPWLLAPALW
jgi:hypothetical protein